MRQWRKGCTRHLPSGYDMRPPRNRKLSIENAVERIYCAWQELKQRRREQGRGVVLQCNWVQTVNDETRGLGNSGTVNRPWTWAVKNHIHWRSSLVGRSNSELAVTTYSWKPGLGSQRAIVMQA